VPLLFKFHQSPWSWSKALTAAAAFLVSGAAAVVIEQLIIGPILAWPAAPNNQVPASEPTSRASSSSSLVARALQRLGSGGGGGSSSQQRGSPFRSNIIDSVLEYQDRQQGDSQSQKTDEEARASTAARSTGGAPSAIRQDNSRLLSRLLSTGGSFPTDQASPPASLQPVPTAPHAQPAARQQQQQPPQQQVLDSAASAAAAAACYRSLAERMRTGGQPTYVSALRRHQVRL
jgi:hypothetical protein